MNINKILVVCSLTIGVFGCANNVWVKSGATANDFNVDRAQCNAQSYSIPFASIYQQAAVQNECMVGKGWILKDKASHEASDSASANSWKAVMDKSKADSELRCKDPSFKVYYSKTACFAQDMTFEQMADDSKITPQQKPVLMAVKKSVDSQLAQVYNSLKQIPNAPGEKVASLYKSFEIEIDKNALDLYSGKISWGDYNRKRKEIAAKQTEAHKNLK